MSCLSIDYMHEALWILFVIIPLEQHRLQQGHTVMHFDLHMCHKVLQGICSVRVQACITSSQELLWTDNKKIGCIMPKMLA